MNYIERKARVSFRKDVIGGSTHSQATQTSNAVAVTEQHSAIATKTTTATVTTTPIANVGHTNSVSTSTAIGINTAAGNSSSTSAYSDSDRTTFTIGRYTNWHNEHAALAALPWCCIGDLMYFCDKYEFKPLSASDTKTHSVIVAQVTALLSAGRAPFDAHQRFPADMHSPENLWVCVGRCPSVEYHLKRILSAFRKPLANMSADKRRAAMQNFHLALNELRLDISARITEVRLYDRPVFEREFHLQWLDEL